MEATFDEAMERIIELAEGDIDQSELEPSGPSPEDLEGMEQPEEPADPAESEEPTETEDAPAPVPAGDADELLQEFSELFSDYQDALSNGNWEEAAEIMAEIETQLESANE